MDEDEEKDMNAVYYYLVISALTFVVYGTDKWAARKNFRRVPERTLHIFSLVGGFMGALLGRKYFRHKTTRPEFFIIPVICGVIHMAVWIVLDKNIFKTP